ATTGLLLDTRLDDEQRELAELVRVSGEGLLTVLNDILDFSKVEAGRLHLEQTDFDLRELIDDAVELQAVAAAERGLEVAVEIDPAMPTGVRGDPYRLRQVLMNLLGNAVKFTAEGEVLVKVHCRVAEAGNAWYVLEVKDSGIGLSKEAQAQLFRPFVQADTSTTRRFGGTGLGLAITKGLVDLMQGQITVESELGRGSTFTVTIPLQLQPRVARPAPRFALGADAALLLVEPDADNRRRLGAQLAEWGLAVRACADAREANEAVNEVGTRFVAAIVGLKPVDDALRLARELRTLRVWQERPVLLMTTQASRVPASMLAEHGVDTCLFRPVRRRQLEQALRRVLKQPVAVTEASVVTSGAEAELPTLDLLLVEDNPVNQRVATLMLRKMNCEVTVAENGRQAVEALAQRGYDLVLMDCQMPEMDGLEATRRIRAAEAAGRWGTRPRQRIVAMTANAMQGDRERCLEAGMDDYLVKPVKAPLLQAILNRHCRGRAAVPAA
ncbi:MAG TPA: response regulator, partial [Candidatus Synoicihabitans sp.]|nr:response regulator [Candidatus Synoicihabitans sp.]